jgi:hypothetical protein
MQYSTNCIKNEHLPINTNWIGTVFTTKGVKGLAYSMLKDTFTPYEWAGQFADGIKQLNKKDKSSKYIGGLMQHKDKYILVCTVDKHRDTLEKLADAVLAAN